VSTIVGLIFVEYKSFEKLIENVNKLLKTPILGKCFTYKIEKKMSPMLEKKYHLCSKRNISYD